MEPGVEEYKGHAIELRRGEGAREEDLDLLIDGNPIRYGQLPDGRYALEDYAYDWQDDLFDLTRRFIDYREKVDSIQRSVRTEEED